MSVLSSGVGPRGPADGERPVVVALPLEEAKEVLDALGIAVVEVAETRARDPAPTGAPSGPLRVVRERYSPDGAHLVTARATVVAAARPAPAGEG